MLWLYSRTVQLNFCSDLNQKYFFKTKMFFVICIPKAKYSSLMQWFNTQTPNSDLLLSRSVMSDTVAPWTTALQASLSFTISCSLLQFMSIESVMTSNYLTLCCPLLLLPSVVPSIRVFSNESVLRIRWPKYWSFSFNISHLNEYSGLILFRIDWFNLLAVQGTLKSLLQHHRSKASILQCSAFFMVQLSHLYSDEREN